MFRTGARGRTKRSRVCCAYVPCKPARGHSRMSPTSSPTKCCSPNQATCSLCCPTPACGWRTARSMTRCWHERWCRKPSSPPGSTPRRASSLLTACWPTTGVKPCRHARGLPAPGGPWRRGSPQTGWPLPAWFPYPPVRIALPRDPAASARGHHGAPPAGTAPSGRITTRCGLVRRLSRRSRRCAR